MTGKFPPASNSNSLYFRTQVLPWIICGLAAAFYCYEYLLRITPGLMLPELQIAFSNDGIPLDYTRISYLSFFYYIAYLPMQLFVGLFMDRYGPRIILTIAVLACAVGTVMFATTSEWWVAAVGRFWIGFGSAFAFVGVLKLASTWLPPNRFALVSGLTTGLGMIGALYGAKVLSKLVHGTLISGVGWRETLVYSSYVGFALVPIIWFIVRDSQNGDSLAKQNKGHVKYKQLFTEILKILKNRQIWLNGAIGGLIMVPTAVFPEFIATQYLRTVHQFSPETAATAGGMIFLGWAVGGPIAGFLSDFIRRRRSLLMIGSLAVTILLSCFVFIPDLSSFTIFFILFLVGVFSSVEILCFAIGRENTHPNLAGTVVAITNFLVVFSAFFQIVVAKILDRTWDGVVVGHAKAYSIAGYKASIMVLPACTIAAFCLCFLLKETYCKSVYKE